ncbi:MAG: septation protein A [Proteobacteria bacterium]|nr:septation protein A [Pseudomonadota bacterium]
MKLLLDFLPLVLFFGTFKYADHHADWAARFATDHFGYLVSGGVVGTEEAPVLLATLVVAAATTLQIAVMLARRKHIDLMLWITFGLVVVLGGATVWFHNPTFIKWKPSLLYWAMGLAFWASQALFRKNLLQSMIGDELDLPARIWQRLNFAWIGFFALMGLLNLYVVYSYSTSAWATFKTFGATGLMLAFTVAQGVYLTRHIRPEPEAGASQAAASERAP